MTIRWGFWSFWVGMNAITGFIWAIVLLPPSLASIGGILLGIAIFILFYGWLESYLINIKMLRLRDAMLKGVYIKSALQLLIVPEIWAGMAATFITKEWLKISEYHYPFLSGFFNTLFTGSFLSVLVALITLVTVFFLKKN